MSETLVTTLFWLLSFGAIAYMLLKYREADRVSANANPAAHYTDLEGRLEIARAEMERLEAARQMLEPTKLELESLTLRRQGLLDEITLLEGQRKLITDDLQNLQPEKENLDRVRRELGVEIEKLADARQQHAAVLTDLEVSKAMLAGQQESKRQLDESIRKYEEEQKALAASVDELARQKSRLETELGHLADKVKQLAAQSESTRLQASELEQEVNLLKREQQAIEITNGRLKQENASLEKKLTEQQQKQMEVERQLTEKAKRLELAKVETEASEKRLAGVRAELAKAEESRDHARNQFHDFQSQARALETEIAAYTTMVETLREDYAKKGGVGPIDVNKSLEDLALPALKASFTGPANWNEQDALRRFSDYLKAKGLHYPERVQLAFHTSLKAAQVNPLVVLAGVSGTGKSALPMAYAEALGMNFVSLAVQPGWSGPQDLLGFYNYLERKYKATELARALAQMSPYSDRDLPGLAVKSRKEQILLLLLDEMNLARIEYYFSDFLSRLEQRTGRAVTDDQSRRAVSLLVDAGSLLVGESPRFIYPDHNVLFVGTMNEDESTQSLSEKVIDRANVLRFGAPKELKASSTSTASPAGQFLRYDNWKNWLKPLADNSFAAEREQLEVLNATLESVNRPFAHRVYRAILEYLSNYPGASDNEGKRRHALADQIEQKIIPKLRGLDTQNNDDVSRCLDVIDGVVRRLDDKALLEAFEKARTQPLFEWFGVRRS